MIYRTLGFFVLLFAVSVAGRALAQTISNNNSSVVAGRDVVVGGNLNIHAAGVSRGELEQLLRPIYTQLKELGRECPSRQYRIPAANVCCPVGQAWRDNECRALTLDDACTAGNAAACVEAAEHALKAQAPDKALTYLNAPCSRADYHACTLKGRIVLDVYPERAGEVCAVLSSACQNAQGLACSIHGSAVDRGLCDGNQEQAYAAMIAACRKGLVEYCASIGLAWLERKLILEEHDVRTLMVGACAAGQPNAFSCHVAGLALLTLYEKTKIDTNAHASLRAFKTACDAGLSRSCGFAGYMYFNGNGVVEDDQAAFMLFVRACDLGDRGACVTIGRMYEIGILVRNDKDRARRYYDRGCQLEDGSGCYHQALLEWTAFRDYRKAPSLFAKACRANHLDSCAAVEVLNYSAGGEQADTSLDRLRSICREAPRESKSCQFVHGYDARNEAASLSWSSDGISGGGLFAVYERDDERNRGGLQILITESPLEGGLLSTFSKQDAILQVPIGLRVVSWPRSDVRAQSLVNISAGAALRLLLDENVFSTSKPSKPLAAGSLYLSQTFRFSCAFGVRVEANWPVVGHERIASTVGIPAVHVALGIQAERQRGVYRECGNLFEGW